MNTEGALATTTNHQEQELKQEQGQEHVDATRMRARTAPLDEFVRAPLTTANERQNGRPASVRTARPRPFGGKLRIDVTAAEKEAELASPLAVGSPLGHYATKKLPSNAHEAHPVSMFGPTESHTVDGPLSNVSPFLEYGMLVSLVCDDRNGVIAAEGFASRDVRLERLNYGMEVPLSRLGLGGHEERKLFAEGGFRLLSCPFRDCLFEVVPKMTYDATITLKSLAEDDGRTPRRPSNQHTLANLKFKSDAEIRLNAMMYKKLKGTQVIYGHTIQLRHTKSGKYVSLDPSSMPFRGSEYAPVFLDSGSPSSHFNVLPRFKLRSKGAPVQLTDQMILTSGTETQPFNLYVSNRSSSDGVSNGVVGSSVHSSQWRPVHYDNLDDDKLDVNTPSANDDGLRAGSCVRLSHLESSSWLRFNTQGTSQSSGSVTLQFSDESELEDGTKRALSSDSLWEIERVSVYEGGEIKWREALTLRHLLSGKYLAVSRQQSPRATTRSCSPMRYPSQSCAQMIAQVQPQMFRFMPTAIAEEATQIEDGDVVLIQHLQSSSFIHSIETHASSMADIRLSSKPLSSGANSGGVSFTVVALHGARDEDAFKIIAVPQAEVADTLLLVSYKQALNLFAAQFTPEALSDDDPQYRRFDREESVAIFRKTERVVGELIDFCSDAADNSTEQLRTRQCLFRTHQYVDMLVEMIKAPFLTYGGPFSVEDVCSYNDEFMKSTGDPSEDNDELEMNGSPVRHKIDPPLPFSGNDSSPNSKSFSSSRRSFSTQDYSWRRKSSGGGSVSSSKLEIHAAAMQSLNRIIPAINVLLVHIFWGNRTNELYVVKVAMPILMELLGNGFQTSLPLSYLLRENRNLVESITAYSGIIRNFFELIVTRGKSIRYMQFLVALCTSRGHGVPKTQEAICDFLFNPANGYRDDVIIPVRPCENGFEICMAHVSSAPEPNQAIEAMFNRPATASKTDSSPGKWMPLSTFYEGYYLKGKHRALGQYCYGLFRLYVSLCLDRNYVSIEHIQTAFPRENLLSAVMDTSLSRSLRAVMMDLVRVAYVDCEPQKAVSCPNYTRIWTDVGQNTASSLSAFSRIGYSTEDLAFFTSLKDFCSSYFERLHGIIAIDEVPENELTLAIVRVCRKMLEFGMYATESELSRLVVLLFDLLDERTDQVRDPPEVNEHQNKTRGHYALNHPSSLLLPSALHSRPAPSLMDNQALFTVPQQRSVPVISGSDRRTDWGVATQPSKSLQNSVLFDGAGAMSSIRISKDRDGSRQYKRPTANDGSPTIPGDESPSSSKQPDADSGRHRLMNALANRRLLHKSEGPAMWNVHEMNEVNRVVMEIKDEICAILLLVEQARVDFLISTLLASFQARHGGPPSDSSPRHADIHMPLEDAKVSDAVSATFSVSPRGLDLLPHGHNYPEKMSPLASYLFGSKSLDCRLSLTTMGRRNVTTILMQMLMNEYPPLVSKALELLLQQYNQHDQLLKEMENVQLLVTDETITIYNKLKGDVDDLRRLAETTEVWMDLTSRSDFEKADSVCQLLGSLIKVIQHTKTDESSSESPKPRRTHRELSISSPGKAAFGDESDEEDDNSMGDLLGTNPKCAPKHVQLAEGDDHKPTIRFSIEKQPPNRRLVHSRDRYILNPAFGRVSRHSGCHEILPLLSNDRIGFVTEDASAEDGAATEGKTLAVEAQRLLRNLRAAQFVLNMLRDGAHFFEGHFEVERPEPAHAPSSPTTRSRTKLQTRQRDQIRAVFAQGMQFLCAFCMGDAENQAVVAPHATMIAQYAGELAISQELLVAIYTDNFPLYRAIPTELINRFVDRLVNDDPNPRYLLFLETLVICNERPVIENQLLVLFQLVKSLENSKVLQAFDEAARTIELLGELFQRHAQCLSDGSEGDKRPELETAASATRAITLLPILLMSTNTTSESHSPTTANCHNGASIAELLEYHVRLLHLFAACATGKNTRVQEICQQILPLLNVVDLLRHANCTEGVQLALLRYLDQVFLTADEIETPGIDDLVQILMVLSEVCETRVIQFLRLTQVKDVNRLATLSLRKNKTKFGKRLGLSAQSPAESAPLYLVLFSAIPTLFSFLQQFPRLFETSEEAHYYLFHAHQCVALLLTVCSANKWHLSEDAVAIIEEFVYLMDKTVRVDMLEDPVLPQASLEQSWSASLKYPERLDCSSMDFEQELPYLLQWALGERDKDRSSDAGDAVSVSDKVETHTHVLRNISELSSGTAAVHNASLSNGTWRAASVHGASSCSNGTVDIEGATYKKAGGDTSIEDALIASAIPDRLDVTRPAVWGANAAVSRGRSREAKQLHRKIRFSKGNHSRLTPYDAAMGPASIVQKNHGRLLHRLSPTRFCKGLRVCGSQNSALSTSSAFSRSSPDRYRCSEGSPGPFDVEQTEDSQFFGRHQQHFHEFDQFLNWLRLHPNVHSAMRDELNQMVQGILGIEASLKDEYDPQAHLSNVRLSFDLVVSKLVAHVEALQDPSYLKTNLTLLNVFCRMIYAVEDPEECHNMQIKLNQLGVTRLVVQLIASRDNDALFASSIQVGVALLDGMNAEVQESFCNHWREANNALFFERIQARIEKACKLIRNVDRVDLNTTSHSHGDGDVDDAFISSVELGVNAGDKVRHRHSIFDLGLETPSSSTPKAGEKRRAKRLGAPVTSIFRFLQLLCEGHYLNAQRALIAQPHAARSTNLVETTTSFLLDTYLALADLDMGLITQLFETITECCQGPCMEAQETVANYKFISAVNALLTHSFEQRDAQAQLAARQLRASIVITLLSLLEGRSDYVLHIQLVQELNFEALKMNLVEVYSHFLRKHGAYAGNSKCSEDFYLTMGFNIYILLQQLADRHPQQAWWIPPSKIDKFEVSLSSPTPQESTRGKIYSVGAATDGVAPDYHDAYYFFQSNCAKVEVVWDHHRSPAASNPGRGLSAGGKMDGVSSIGDAGGGSGLFSDPVPTGASTLIPFYFPLHPICFCLTEQSKKKLVWVVSRGVDKLSDFYARSDKLVDEMTHQSHLQHHRHISWLAKKLDRLKRVSFAVAVGINLIVLLFYRAGGIDSRPYAASQITFIHAWGAIAEPPSPSLWIDYGLSLVGTIQIVLYCVMLVCYMLNSAPLLIKKGWKRRHQVERARRSKRTVHSAQLRSTESKERESFRDTERLLRSLRERENEYDYLFLPPPFRKVSATRRVLNTTSAPASTTDSTKTRASSSTGDKLEGTPSPRRRLRLQLETVGVSLFFLIRNPRVLYSLWQIVIAILGSYVNKLYFAFLLLDVVDRYKELNNVLRSVVRPAKALGMTTLLYLIVVYVFAVVGFFFFREDYTPSSTLTEDQREGRAPYTCQRLFQCFLVSLDQGLKSDGGLGSFLREIPLGTNAHSYGRLAFDVLFNILLVVLLLNLVFGVIIDTFASLRTDDQEKTLDMKSRCFICSIDAYSFDRATKRGFHDHVSRDHNMWHYLYLFVHIRKKRITDYNGLELFLAMRMAKKDVSFFPTHRALSLETRDTLGELSEAYVGLEDDRFFAGNSHYGSRRSASTPLSPTRSSVSGVARSSSQRRVNARSRGRSRSSSVSFQAASVVHAGGYFDTAPAGKLEKMEASIATLVTAQNEMKEAQQRAEERHTELLAVITGWQQQQQQQQQQQRQESFYGSFSSVPPSPADNASPTIGLQPTIPRRPSARIPGSTTPRIFSFDAVLDEETSDGTLESSREQNPPAVVLPSPISRRPGSVAPLFFNLDAMSNEEENTEDVPRAHHASR